MRSQFEGESNELTIQDRLGFSGTMIPENGVKISREMQRRARLHNQVTIKDQKVSSSTFMTLREVGLQLTEWYSREVIMGILQEILFLNDLDQLSGGNEEALMRILGYIEDFLRNKRLEIPIEVLKGISEKFQILPITKKQLRDFRFRLGRIRANKSRNLMLQFKKSQTSIWDTLFSKLFDLLLKSSNNKLECYRMLDLSAVIVERVRKERFFFKNLDSYLWAIASLVFEEVTKSSFSSSKFYPGHFDGKEKKAYLNARGIILSKFNKKLPKVNPWSFSETTTLKRRYSQGSTLEEIYELFGKRRYRRSLLEIKVKTVCLEHEGELKERTRVVSQGLKGMRERQECCIT